MMNQTIVNAAAVATVGETEGEDVEADGVIVDVVVEATRNGGDGTIEVIVVADTVTVVATVVIDGEEGTGVVVADGTKVGYAKHLILCVAWSASVECRRGVQAWSASVECRHGNACIRNDDMI